MEDFHNKLQTALERNKKKILETKKEIEDFPEEDFFQNKLQRLYGYRECLTDINVYLTAEKIKEIVKE